MELFNLNRLKRPQLIELAGKVDIKSRHRLRKRDLIQELRKFLPVLKDELNRLRLPAKSSTRTQATSSMPAKPAPAPAPTAQFVDRGAPLAEHYGQDRLLMLVRDPYWVFCYWELEGQAREKMRAQHGGNVFDGARWVLRMHPASGPVQDIDVKPESRNWYINVPDNSEMFAEIGIIAKSGEFLGLASSNRVKTPRAGMSESNGTEWMTVEGDYANIRRQVSVETTIQTGTKERLAERFGVRGLSSLFFGAGKFLGASEFLGASRRASRIPPK